MKVGVDIAEAAAVLARGGLVALPTETVYGLGADGRSAAAVARIFAVKGRPAAHPLILHLASGAELTQWAREVPSMAFALAARFWPGPLTLILKRADRVLLEVTGGGDTVGLRVPAHPMALALLRALGGPVAAPSANRFGRVSPTAAEHVVADLGDDVDYVLDGGRCQVGVESTIVDLSSGSPVLLRPGGVPREAIEAVLGEPLAAPGVASPAAPGTLPSHYAPRARVIAVPAAQLDEALRAASGRVAVLAPAAVIVPDDPQGQRQVRRLPDELVAAARDLYAAIRELDEHGVDAIVAVLPDASGLGEAISDRLRRAGGPAPDRT